MLQVLGLLGSPRRYSNTEILLDKALEGAHAQGAAVEKVALEGLELSPCTHCDNCLETGICTIEDDFQSLHLKLKEADRLVLATPIFFMSLPAQAKLLVDRCQALWVEKYILHVRHLYARDGSRRKGLWIAVGGLTRPNLFDAARATVRAFFATCDVQFSQELLFPGIDARKEILQHPQALEQAFQAGQSLVKT